MCISRICAWMSACIIIYMYVYGVSIFMGNLHVYMCLCMYIRRGRMYISIDLHMRYVCTRI